MSGMVKKYVTSKVISALAQKFGINASTAQVMAAQAIPMFLGGLSRNAQKDDTTAQGLFNAIKNDHDGSVFNHVADDNGGLLAEGSKILGHVFGDKASSISHVLGMSAGVDDNKAGDFLKALSPLMMGAIGKEQTANNMGMADVLNEFKSYGKTEQGSTSQSIMMNLLDQDNDGSVVDDVFNMAKRFLT